jgi:hypothetical protein
MMANLRHVVQAAEPFARDPRWQNLIALKPGMDAGEWRDSNDGLGGGRYPYDVNAVLVPAALEAAAAMAQAGLLDAYAGPEDRAMLGRVEAMAKVWHEAAPRLFLQSVDAPTARARIGAYARAQGCRRRLRWLHWASSRCAITPSPSMARGSRCRSCIPMKALPC